MMPLTTLTPRRIEELTLNGWPALQTVLLDGWVLRFADGYTRRANSVNPLYPSGEVGDSPERLARKVEQCEALYAQRGLDTVFKLTEASEPAGLDALLERRGYEREATTSVQLAEIDRPVRRAERAPGSGAGGPGTVEEVGTVTVDGALPDG